MANVIALLLHIVGQQKVVQAIFSGVLENLDTTLHSWACSHADSFS